MLLYELLTRKPPFDTKELMQSGLDEMRKIVREREPVRLWDTAKIRREPTVRTLPVKLLDGISPRMARR